MRIDARLLANMIACGIQAAGEELREPLEVTINEAAGIVYVRTIDARFFRVTVAELHPSPSGEEEPRA